MKIDLKLLKKLRQLTFVGYDFCKKALLVSNNNFEKALEWLNQQGIIKGAKRMQNKTDEGVCQVFVWPNNDTALFLELNCETDFVADNQEFRSFFHKLGQLIYTHNAKEKSEVLQLNWENETIENVLLKMSHKFGEKITIGNLLLISKKTEQLFAFYNHNDFAHSALLIINSLANEVSPSDLEVLAMHVVAMKPQFISWKKISPTILAKEKVTVTKLIEEKTKTLANFTEQQKKQMIEKKMKKNLESLCLLNQKFVKEPNLTVGQYLQKYNLEVKKLFFLKAGTKIYEC